MKTSSSIRNVTLRQLEVFSYVARLLSFSKAARALNVTQPAVSMQIQQLEAVAGIAIFERNGRRISLTEAGQRLLACASGMDDLLQEAEQLLGSLRGGKTGTLKISAVSTAKYFAPSLVAAFNAVHPEITVRFSVDGMTEIARQLSGNEIDLAISGRPVPGVDAHVESFARHPYVIIASPSHPLARKRRIPLKQLEKERFLTREPDSGTGMLMARLFKERRVRYQSIMESGSNETIKQSVIAGMGISFLSMHTASLELTTRKLVALDVIGLPVLSDWYVIHTLEKRLSPIAAAFRDFLFAQGATLIENATHIPSKSKRRVHAHHSAAPRHRPSQPLLSTAD